MNGSNVRAGFEPARAPKGAGCFDGSRTRIRRGWRSLARTRAACASIAILFMVCSLTLAARTAQTPISNTLNGVFTADQAAKGEAVYQDKCAKCHEGDDAAGPALTGTSFIDRWREDNLDVFFDFIKDNMPADAASSLSDSEYLALVAHILDVNGYPDGNNELSLDALPKIRFVGKDGPKPLPNNTLVQAIGCLTQTGDNDWTLTKASSLSRTREGTDTSPEELKRSTARPLGSEQFSLQNFTRISLDFKPDAFKDHKVQVKGVLVHQSNGKDRISLTLFNSLTPTCTQ